MKQLMQDIGRKSFNKEVVIMEKNKVDVKGLFNDLQDEMILRLKTHSNNIKHPVSRGDTTELNWIEWLRKYLPKRYTVDKGFVVDNKGNLSQQIDVIIYDTLYCPFIFNQDEIKYIPAESVFAVFEVKQSLNSKNLKYACEKANSVRILERTTKNIEGAERQLVAKVPKNIICGLLTTKSDWEQNEDENLLKNLKTDVDSRLDYVCSLKSHSYSLTYLKDKINHVKSSKNESLIYLFIKLFVALQNMGNPPAMDIIAYAKAIDSI